MPPSMFTIAPAPTLSVVPPANVPLGSRSRVIPWGSAGTLSTRPVPELGSGVRTPLPTTSEEPLPLTVTVAPVAVIAAGGGSVSVPPPLISKAASVATARAGKLKVPPLSVRVPEVKLVIRSFEIEPVPSAFRSVRARLVKSPASTVPPEVTLSEELLLWSETIAGRAERSSTLPLPLTSKKLRPVGFEARWLRSILPPLAALKVMKLLVVPPRVVTCDRSTSLGVPVPLLPLAWIVGPELARSVRLVTFGNATAAQPEAKTEPLMVPAHERGAVKVVAQAPEAVSVAPGPIVGRRLLLQRARGDGEGAATVIDGARHCSFKERTESWAPEAI